MTKETKMYARPEHARRATYEREETNQPAGTSASTSRISKVSFTDDSGKARMCFSKGQRVDGVDPDRTAHRAAEVAAKYSLEELGDILEQFAEVLSTAVLRSERGENDYELSAQTMKAFCTLVVNCCEHVWSLCQELRSLSHNAITTVRHSQESDKKPQEKPAPENLKQEVNIGESAADHERLECRMSRKTCDLNKGQSSNTSQSSFSSFSDTLPLSACYPPENDSTVHELHRRIVLKDRNNPTDCYVTSYANTEKSIENTIHREFSDDSHGRKETPQYRECQAQSSALPDGSETTDLSGDHSQRPSLSSDPREFNFNSSRPYKGRDFNKADWKGIDPASDHIRLRHRISRENKLRSKVVISESEVVLLSLEENMSSSRFKDISQSKSEMQESNSSTCGPKSNPSLRDLQQVDTLFGNITQPKAYNNPVYERRRFETR